VLIRPLRDEDVPALVALSRDCARGETDFVLNPLWESEEELEAEFARFGIAAEDHVLVADRGDGEVVGMIGFLRHPGDSAAGMFCPIVKRGERGRGFGGELLRAAQDLAAGSLGIRLLTAGIGTRNRAGYSLLTSHGFRPSQQAFLMRCDRAPDEESPPDEGVRFEAATADDGEAILALYRECGFGERSPERMRSILGDGRHAHSVARRGDEIAGFVEIETHWPQRVWLAFVGITREQRDHGLGSALASWSLRRCFEAGAVSALLMLSPANRSALRAYEKVGFRRHRLVDILEKSLA
jgi:ribosomal protein S18 acetylase RimI-like enzyme